MAYLVTGLFSHVRRLILGPLTVEIENLKIISKLGRILKYKLQQCYKLIKALLQTENEDTFGFELWPRFSVHLLLIRKKMQ